MHTMLTHDKRTIVAITLQLLKITSNLKYKMF